MPLVTRPTIAVTGIKDGDRLLFTDALDPDAAVPAMPLIESREYPSKGKHKGLVLVKVKGKAEPIVLDPDTQIIVERNVPLQAERDAYFTAWKRWFALKKIVDAQAKYLDGIKAMRLLAESLEDGDQMALYRGFGGGVSRHTASVLDAAAGSLRATWDAYGEQAEAEGLSYDDLLVMARNHNAIRGVTIHNYQPRTPQNGDCYSDGLPAPRPPRGGSYTVVPFSREQHEAEIAAEMEGDDKPRAEVKRLLVDRYAGQAN